MARQRLPGWLCWLLIPLIYLPNFGTSHRYAALLTIVIQPLLFFLFVTSKVEGRQRMLALWLGLLSFAVYMVHVPIQYLAELLARRALGLAWEADPPSWLWMLGLPVSLALAHVLTFRSMRQ